MKTDYDDMDVAQLRTYLRQQYGAKTRFTEFDSHTFSQFVNLGKRSELITACTTGKLVKEAPEGINMTIQPKLPLPDKPQDPLAFVKEAIDKARSDGEQEGIRKAQQTVAGLQSEIDELKAQLKAAPAPIAPVAKVNGASSALQVVQGGRIGGIEIPKEDKYYIIDNSRMEIIDACLERSIETDMPKGMLLVGPKGCGKSTLPEQWSHRKKRPFYKANAALLREAKEWFGSKSAMDGSLYFIMSEFCVALETPNCTVLIDEINRAIAQALNSLLGILDSGRCYVEELGRPVHIAKGVLVCASMNEGAEYTVHELDSALKDRFPVRLECNFLPKADEIQVLMNKAGVTKELAGKAWLLADNIRKKHVEASGIGGTFHETISTRQLIEIAWFLKKKGKESLQYTVTNRFSSIGGRDSEQCAVAAIIQGIFG